MDKSLILFDGCCNLCSRSVQFIIKRDPGDHFRFVPIQSGRARELLDRCGAGPDLVETMVLIEEGKCYNRSDAALRIARRLTGLWPALSALRVVPKSLRDRSYQLIARNRHLFFGRSETCLLPPRG